ncbi:MAG TPA: hypothetical protein VK849_11155 [Longimicrobiales bacterium]|nr:hypothetical protein [Longimicrobiales bacterium]
MTTSEAGSAVERVEPPAARAARGSARRGRRGGLALGLALALWAPIACDAGRPAARAEARAPAVRQVEALPDSAFAGLVARISEPGGWFDTDNLISNESGYLTVVGALERLGVSGGAYVGVGPDQNYSYIAHVRPRIAFITDIRRDNLLHHLLLKALVERAPTRVEFLSGLHGRRPPPDAPAWEDRPVEEIVAWVDGQPVDVDGLPALDAEIAEAVTSWGVPLTDQDLATVHRFHHAFVDAGPDLRFTSFGRPPRSYYPTYRQLLLETDLEGRRASYLATAEGYASVRALHLANRIVPVVGDLAGEHALREIGRVLREMGLALSALYASNVEFYLARSGTLGAWIDNVASLPAQETAVVIRSYFPSFGGAHPSAVPGYYATQTLQPVSVLVEGGFSSYWDLVTRGVVDLR